MFLRALFLWCIYCRAFQFFKFSKFKSCPNLCVWKKILGSNSQHCMMSTFFFFWAEWRMKGKNSWIDHWYPSIRILLVLWDMIAHHWLSWRPWWRDWIILQSSSSVNYRSLFCGAGGGVKGGGSKKDLKAPQLSSGSLIDCIRVLYKTGSLKQDGLQFEALH